MTTGRRKGVKRSDRRWIDPEGGEWDSKFEWLVYEGLRGNGDRVRRCGPGDTIAYKSSVKQGRCLECSSDKVVQERTYTADLFMVRDNSSTTPSNGGGYLIECKGYFPGPKRKLLRDLSKQLQGVSLRIIFESNRPLRGTKKTTPVEYMHKYCREIVPGVWDKKAKEVIWYEH